MKVVVHAGVVWAYSIGSGWFTHIRAFPTAKGVNDPQVLKYVKENTHA